MLRCHVVTARVIPLGRQISGATRNLLKMYLEGHAGSTLRDVYSKGVTLENRPSVSRMQGDQLSQLGQFLPMCPICRRRRGPDPRSPNVGQYLGYAS